MSGAGEAWGRFAAILVKEFRQVRRDRLAFAMMIVIPILQLILFGYAINTDPRQLPVAVVTADPSEFSRSLEYGMENSRYFRITHRPASEAEGDRLLAQGTHVEFSIAPEAGHTGPRARPPGKVFDFFERMMPAKGATVSGR